MNTKALQGTHVIVTGASSGLGYSMAKALLQAGATVALASRPGSKLDEAVGQLKQQGYAAVELPLDVRSEHSVEEAVQWVKGKWGRLDVLVNNAGIGMRTVNPRFLVEPQPFFKVTPEGFRNLMDTNLTGYFLVSRGFAPLMIEQGKGRMINISMNHETMRRKGFVPLWTIQSSYRIPFIYHGGGFEGIWDYGEYAFARGCHGDGNDPGRNPGGDRITISAVRPQCDG
jgi:NAD(P)-dependent dehydrogenase (short-subunit alcohol dehydrogenase family)